MQLSMSSQRLGNKPNTKRLYVILTCVLQELQSLLQGFASARLRLPKAILEHSAMRLEFNAPKMGLEVRSVSDSLTNPSCLT